MKDTAMGAGVQSTFWARAVVLVAGAIGFLIGVGLTDPGNPFIMGLFSAPFVIALASFLSNDLGIRRKLWLESAIFAALLAVPLLFAVPLGTGYLLLALGLGWAYTSTRSTPTPETV
jgi:hypothetical protein